jgi:hypothetical protein
MTNIKPLFASLLFVAVTGATSAAESPACTRLLGQANQSAEQQALLAFRCRKPVADQARPWFDHLKAVHERAWEKLPWQSPVADWHRLEKTVEWADRNEITPVEIIFGLEGAERSRKTKVRRGLLNLSVRMAFCLDAGYGESAVDTVAHFARKDPEALLEEIFAIERRFGATALNWEIECGRAKEIESSSPVAELLGVALVEALDEPEREAFQKRITALRRDRREFQGREIEAFFVQFEATTEE